MFTITPRDYQIECLNALWNYFLKHSGNPICALPQGTGKSVCIAMFNMKCIFTYPQTRILNVTHSKELIDQNFKKFMGMWTDAPAGVYSASLKRRDTFQNAIFAGVASIVRNLEKFGAFDLIVVDECHLFSDNEKSMYYKIFNHFIKLNPNLKVVGFTATPWRLGSGDIVNSSDKAIFTDICFDVTSMEAFNRFIMEGYLMPLIPKDTKTKYDITDVGTTAGDYNQIQLDRAMNVDNLTIKALEECFDNGHNRNHWLLFTTSIDHAVKTADFLTQMGRPCKALHSKLKTTEERDYIIEGFMAGEWEVTNMGILTTGFDFPALDFIGFITATQSPIKWAQALGRGTRPDYAKGYDTTVREGRLEAIQASEKHNCLVMDFGGNTGRLGPINDPVKPRKKGQKRGMAPVKKCPICDTQNHISATNCAGIKLNGEACSHVFTFEVKIQGTSSNKDLFKMELPRLEDYKVDTVIYQRHKKIGKPDAVKVNYYVGLKRYFEYVCIEHGGYPTDKALAWWVERSLKPCPKSTNELLEVIHTLQVPTHIRVHVNRQFPEITARCYDGSNFGTETATYQQTATVEVEGDEEPEWINYDEAEPRGTDEVEDTSVPIDFDDDIPF